MNKNIFFWLILAAMTLSCTSESLKTTFSKQETNIETYLTNQLSADSTYYVVSNGGSQRLVVSPGSGDSLSSSGTVSFYYAGYVLKSSTISSSNLFATNDTTIANYANWNISDSTLFHPDTVNLSDGTLVEGLRDGIIGVQAGEECYVLFSGKYGFGSHVLGTIPANSALVYYLRIESVSN